MNPNDIDIILHSRKTFLFLDETPWIKKENPDFDVSMGSWDGAECCELVGLYLLNQIELVFPHTNVGLYRDDGIGVVDLPGPDVERLRKKITKLFQDNSLKITIEANIKITTFLDVCFNLVNGTFKPYRKDNDKPSYINIQSNHPPHIKKQLPDMISKRLSTLSSSKEIFDNEIPIYTDALRHAGYNQQLQYKAEPSNPSVPRRRRKIIWFNPPYITLKLLQMLLISFFF